jgi:hypothetical protein
MKLEKQIAASKDARSCLDYTAATQFKRAPEQIDESLALKETMDPVQVAPRDRYLLPRD